MTMNNDPSIARLRALFLEDRALVDWALEEAGERFMPLVNGNLPIDRVLSEARRLRKEAEASASVEQPSGETSKAFRILQRRAEAFMRNASPRVRFLPASDQKRMDEALAGLHDAGVKHPHFDLLAQRMEEITRMAADLRLFSGATGTSTEVETLRRRHRKHLQTLAGTIGGPEALAKARASCSFKQWVRDTMGEAGIELIRKAHRDANMKPELRPDGRTKNKKKWSDGAKWRTTAQRKNKNPTKSVPKKKKKKDQAEEE